MTTQTQNKNGMGSEVPVLRFPEFSGAWEETKLGSIGDVVMCKRVMKYQASSSGDVPFFKIGTFGRRPDAFITQELYEDYKRRYPFPKEGAILISASGTIGRTVVYDGKPAYFQDSNIIWLDNSEHVITNNFLSYLYTKVKWPTASATIARLYNSAFKGIKVNTPSIPEQQKIADFLGVVDEKIEGLSKKKASLERYKKGVMQRIFSQEIRFKDESGNSYPDWEEKKLGEIATFQKGKNISKEDILEDGSLECIRYGELYTSYKEVIRLIKSRTNLKSRDLVLSEGNDVIIPASGETQWDIATASCVLKGGVALGGDINIIRNKENGVFLAYYLSNAKRKDIARLSQGNSVVHLYSSQLKSLKLILPSLPEQKKIADFLMSLDKKISAISSELDRAKDFKKGLLQQMFV